MNVFFDGETELEDSETAVISMHRMSHVRVVETRTKTCNILGSVLEKDTDLNDLPKCHEEPKPGEEKHTTINIERI